MGWNTTVAGYFQYEHTPHMVHSDTLPGDHHPKSQSWHTDGAPAATTADAEPVEQPVQTAALPRE
jgi:hypothetical protein